MSTYINNASRPGYGHRPDDAHSWQTYTERRLTWAHGPERAHLIVSGRDPATNADIATWNNLGRGGVREVTQ
jgi:hypothetical protein